MPDLDALDLALLTALRENPRSGALALSRLTRVARATVESRLSRLERSGVITGYGPDIDVAAAGFTVLAFVTLEIAQGALDRVKSDLAAIPAVLEAYAVTGSADMICKVAATSHADLQQTLLRIDSSPSVARSTSAIALSTVIAPRDLPLLTSRDPGTTPRSPAFRLPRVSVGPWASAQANSVSSDLGLVEAETDLQRHLEVDARAVLLDPPADVADLEPVEVVQGLRGAADGHLDRIVNAGGRGADDLAHGIDAV